jgi:hypothetical protein
MLEWMKDPELRRRVQVGLNKESESFRGLAGCQTARSRLTIFRIVFLLKPSRWLISR